MYSSPASVSRRGGTLSKEIGSISVETACIFPSCPWISCIVKMIGTVKSRPRQNYQKFIEELTLKSNFVVHCTPENTIEVIKHLMLACSFSVEKIFVHFEDNANRLVLRSRDFWNYPLQNIIQLFLRVILQKYILTTTPPQQTAIDFQKILQYSYSYDLVWHRYRGLTFLQPWKNVKVFTFIHCILD